MADVLVPNSDKDLLPVVRQLVERFQSSEDVAAGAAVATTQIIAGSGLTGGGTLEANRTLNVGAGTGITVNADDVAISTDGVTNTLLSNMATKTYKGRTSGGTGDPEDVAAATVRSDIAAEQLGVTRGINVQNSSYTLVLTDAGQTVFMNNGSANNLTVPPNSSVAFVVGTYVNFIQLGAGQTTLVPGSGVTISSYNSALKTMGQYAAGTILYTGSDNWFASGNLTP